MTRAFTLIEQLAAVALASLFMLAGLAVLGRLARDGTTPSPRDSSRALSRASDLIEWDLTQANRFRVEDDGAVLSGFGSMDAAMNPTHRPSRVEYRLTRFGDTRRLVRRQTNLDVLSNRATREDWVSDDVSRIEMVPLSATKPTTRPAAEMFGPADGLPVADVMKLVLVPADGGVPPVTRVCRLR
jgi:hypothetical protein